MIRDQIYKTDIYKDFTPLPARIQGWDSESVLFEEMILATKPKVIIEVGTWLGASAIHMAKTCKKHGFYPEIVCIDTWLGNIQMWNDPALYPELQIKNGYPAVYYQFLSNVVAEECQDLITPLPNTSDTGFDMLKQYGCKADLIYVDAAHEYLPAKQDIKNYVTLLTPTGQIFGDDYDWPTVRRAAEEAAVETNHTLIVKRTRRWAFTK